MKPTVLFSEMTPGVDWEEQFNEWYDTEHIPIRMQVPGFCCARRYKHVDAKGYLAVYEMEHRGVLQSEEYRMIKENPSELTKWMLQNVTGFTRYTGELISEQINQAFAGDPYDAPILYAVMFTVPEERESEFDEWYIQDHVPTLLKNPDWYACRRYRIFSGEPENWTHLALHYLANVNVLDCEERKEARNSPWRARLAQESWFKGRYTIYEKIKTFHAKV